MDRENKEKIVKDLIGFEKEEADLISLYESLMDIGVVDCLPPEKKIEYRQALGKLYYDSKRHEKAIAVLLTKFQ